MDISKSNIIKSILNIVNSDLKTNYNIRKVNRVSDEGKEFENFIKDSFANSFKKKKKEKYWKKVFSYLGSINNPPDIMIKDGDAIEIKKTISDTADIHLNSSQPKSILKSSDKRIKEDCRKCEEWSEKDLIYIIGTIKKKTLTSISMIYGDCLFADNDYYDEKIKPIVDTIKQSDLDLSETQELGRINKVDQLGVSSLRIRGMWIFQNPRKVFKELKLFSKKNTFELFCIMKRSKFESMPDKDKKKIIGLKNSNLQIKDVNIKDPNDKNKQIDCKLISYII
tara:strand:- start:229 stop:1071 length:843 start_codon:yes stop_codon:yes gene_type:complete